MENISIKQVVELFQIALSKLLQSLKRLIVGIEKSLSKAPRIIQTNFANFVNQAKNFHITRIACAVLVLLIMAVTGAYGQDVVLPDNIDISTPQALFEQIEPLYGAFIIIGGYLVAFIPGLNRINDGTVRVLVWAIITAVGFIIFDDNTTVISLAVTYAISTSLYEVVLKWFRKSPKPEEGTTLAVVRVPSEETK